MAAIIPSSAASPTVRPRLPRQPDGPSPSQAVQAAPVDESEPVQHGLDADDVVTVERHLEERGELGLRPIAIAHLPVCARTR